MSRPFNTESVFRAIADPTRRRMLELLLHGERTVAEILESFKLKKTVGSYHLRVLREAGLVVQRRNGIQRVYRLHAPPLRVVSSWSRRFERQREVS